MTISRRKVKPFSIFFQNLLALFVFLFILSFLSLNTFAVEVSGSVFDAPTEWCYAVPESKNSALWEYCRPAEDDAVWYTVEVEKLTEGGLDSYSDVYLTLIGTDGTSGEVQIASQRRGTMTRTAFQEKELRAVQSVLLRAGSSGEWACRSLRVRQGFKEWRFDCSGVLSQSHAPLMQLSLSGHELYTVTAYTGLGETSGTSALVEVELIGTEGKTGLKYLGSAFAPGSVVVSRLHGIDIGELESVRLRVNSVNGRDDAWFCERLSIRTGNGIVYDVMVRQSIGSATAKTRTVLVPYHSASLGNSELAAKTISCEASLATGELAVSAKTPFLQMKVLCPADCSLSAHLGQLAGSSIHPAYAPVCLSALMDGVLGDAGGEVVITAVDQIPTYFGAEAATRGVSSITYSPKPPLDISSYYLYAADSIDAVAVGVRIVDRSGKLAATGRLEVFSQGVWGSVCSRGQGLRSFNGHAARVACREMGFAYGTLLPDGCGDLDACGNKWTPILAAGIECAGKEDALRGCHWTPPQDVSGCDSHQLDVAVTCSHAPLDGTPAPGSLRLVGSDNGIAENGVGRLEVFSSGLGWGSVCNNDWSMQSARVACRQMGYSGVKRGGGVKDVCKSFEGVNLCGANDLPIITTKVRCHGDEMNLSACGMEIAETLEQSDKFFCASTENVVLACEGAGGNPTGDVKQVFGDVSLPKLKFAYVTDGFGNSVSCTSTFKNTILSQLKTVLPGTTVLATCSANCVEDAVDLPLIGSFIYAAGSSLCQAAIHAGVITNAGGHITVTAAHPQRKYFGSERNGLLSRTEDSAENEVAFTVSRPMPSMVTNSILLFGRRFNGQSTLAPAVDSNEEVGGGASQTAIVRNEDQTNDNTNSNSNANKNKKKLTSDKPLPKAVFEWMQSAGQVTPRNNRPLAKDLRSFTLVASFKAPTPSQASTQKGDAGLMTSSMLGGDVMHSYKHIFFMGLCDGLTLSLDPFNNLVFNPYCGVFPVEPLHRIPLDEQENFVVAAVFVHKDDDSIKQHRSADQQELADDDADFATHVAKLYVNGLLVQSVGVNWNTFKWDRSIVNSLPYTIDTTPDRPYIPTSEAGVDLTSVVLFDEALDSDQVVAALDFASLFLKSAQFNEDKDEKYHKRYTLTGAPCRGSCLTTPPPTNKHPIHLQTSSSTVTKTISSSKRPSISIPSCYDSLTSLDVHQEFLKKVNELYVVSEDKNNQVAQNDDGRLLRLSEFPKGTNIRVECPQTCADEFKRSHNVNGDDHNNQIKESMSLIQVLHNTVLNNEALQSADFSPTAHASLTPFDPSTPICMAAYFKSPELITAPFAISFRQPEPFFFTSQKDIHNLAIHPDKIVTMYNNAQTNNAHPHNDEYTNNNSQNVKSLHTAYGKTVAAFFEQKNSPKTAFLPTRSRKVDLLDCDTPGVPLALLPPHTERLLRCPKNCQNSVSSVYGNNDEGYAALSGVCKAAVHSGAITAQKGGEVLVHTLRMPKELPKAHIRNGVVSVDGIEYNTYFRFVFAN